MSKIKTWNERCEEHPDHQTGMVSNSMIQARMQEEIDDLRAALAEPQEPDSPERRCGGPGCDMKCCQPVQEPVGAVLVNRESREGVMFYSVDMIPDPSTLKDCFELVPVYTSPPQRKPLTEEEIDSIWDSEKAFADIYAIARAVERAHGIGGEG